jgi:tetratricopeptide (TPR) repeat protein
MNATKYALLLLLVGLVGYILFRPVENSEPIQARTRVDAEKLDLRLRAIYEADMIADPIARCRNYPAAEGFDWPPELIDHLCRTLGKPPWDQAEIYSLLDDGNFEELEELISESTEQYFSRRISEFKPYQFFNYFHDYGPWIERVTLAWTSTNPQSAYAKLASAIFLKASAERIRGGRSIRQLGDASDRFRQLIGQSNRLVEDAIQIDPRLMPAYNLRIMNSLYESDAEALNWLQKGLAVDPDTYVLRSEYLNRLQPQWYGSTEAMDAFVNDSKPHVRNNPNMPLLNGRVLAVQGRSLWAMDKTREALVLFYKALALAPTNWLLKVAAEAERELGNDIQAFSLLSQISRYSRDSADTEITRASMLLEFSEFVWAEHILREVIRNNPYEERAHSNLSYTLKRDMRFAEALKANQSALQFNPENLYAHKEIAWLTLYRVRNPDLAKIHTDRILEIDPENYHGWLYRADYLRDTGGEPLLDAIRNFLRYVDRADPDMQSSISAMESYLQSHGQP